MFWFFSAIASPKGIKMIDKQLVCMHPSDKVFIQSVLISLGQFVWAQNQEKSPKIQIYNFGANEKIWPNFETLKTCLNRTIADKKEVFAQSVIFSGNPQKHLQLWQKNILQKVNRFMFS